MNNHLPAGRAAMGGGPPPTVDMGPSPRGGGPRRGNRPHQYQSHYHQPPSQQSIYAPYMQPYPMNAYGYPPMPPQYPNGNMPSHGGYMGYQGYPRSPPTMQQQYVPMVPGGNMAQPLPYSRPPLAQSPIVSTPYQPPPPVPAPINIAPPPAPIPQTPSSTHSSQAIPPPLTPPAPQSTEPVQTPQPAPPQEVQSPPIPARSSFRAPVSFILPSLVSLCMLTIHTAPMVVSA